MNRTGRRKWGNRDRKMFENRPGARVRSKLAHLAASDHPQPGARASRLQHVREADGL